MQISPKRRTLVILAASLFAVVALAALVPGSPLSGPVLYGMRQSPQRELSSRIAESVALGATPEQVIKFLDEQQVEHGNYERLTESDSDKRYYPVGTPMIRAIKMRTAVGILGFQSLQVVFAFNEHRRLTRFDVRPIYTAP